MISSELEAGGLEEGAKNDQELFYRDKGYERLSGSPMGSVSCSMTPGGSFGSIEGEAIFLPRSFILNGLCRQHRLRRLNQNQLRFQRWQKHHGIRSIQPIPENCSLEDDPDRK